MTFPFLFDYTSYRDISEEMTIIVDEMEQNDFKISFFTIVFKIWNYRRTM